MGASPALERFLEGQRFLKKSGGALLNGAGAALLRASDLPARASLGQFGTGSTLLRASDLSSSGVIRAGSRESELEVLLGGLSGCKAIEIVGRRSSGRFAIALAALACATAAGLEAALIDLGDHLDPQAAENAGVDLTRLLWVRPRRVKQALAAAEMLLSTGFRLVVAEMGMSPRGARFLPDAVWVRLSRAAEAQGSTLLLLAPYRMSGIAANAVVSTVSARPLWRGAGRGPRLLCGLTSRLTLEKLGRETPGLSASMSLLTPDAFPAPPGREQHEDRALIPTRQFLSKNLSHVPLVRMRGGNSWAG